MNNNAGATVLALRALAAGREVIVSRGQLVEIGGSFRLPEIFEVSGARLREVGTTNRTRLADYERAIGPETAAILRVHRSNFRIVGFTEDAALDGSGPARPRARSVVIDDIGSGALWRRAVPPQVADEPTVAEQRLGRGRSGAVLRRQAAGRPAMRDHGRDRGGDRPGRVRPAHACALRLDKMTLAALEATLAAGTRRRSSGGADSRSGR